MCDSRSVVGSQIGEELPVVVEHMLGYDGVRQKVEELAKVKRAIMKMLDQCVGIVDELAMGRDVLCRTRERGLAEYGFFVGKVPDNVVHQCVDERPYGVGVVLGQQRIQ